MNLITHGCGIKWSNAKYAHCAGCHRTFGGVRAFDMHRRDCACIDPETLSALSLTEDKHTGAPVWTREAPRKADGSRL